MTIHFPFLTKNKVKKCNENQFKSYRPDTHTAVQLLYAASESHLELSERDAEIGLVESVRNVPPERTELASFLHDRVEETQSVHELVERLSDIPSSH